MQLVGGAEKANEVKANIQLAGWSIVLDGLTILQVEEEL